MSDNAYKKLELVGTSKTSLEEAIRNAVAEGAKTGRVDWFEVTEIRGAARDGDVAQFQVTLKAGIKA